MPILVLTGEEDFELSRRLKKLKDSLLDPAWSSVNFTYMDNPELNEICDIALSLPFGAGNKVILVDRCNLFTKKRIKGDTKCDIDRTSDSQTKKRLDHFEQTVSNVSPCTYLIFACPYNFDSTLRLSKIIERHATIEKFEKEKYFPGKKSPRLEAWVRQEAKRFDSTIDSQAIAYLLESTEANLRQISSELERISTEILPKKHMSYDSVRASNPHHSHIFILADRFISGNIKEALAGLPELLSRQSAIPLIAALQTMLSRWIHVKAIYDEVASAESQATVMRKRETRQEAQAMNADGALTNKPPTPDEVRTVASRLKVMPIVVEKDLKRVFKIPIKTLVEKRIQLTRFEDLIKSGQLSEHHALNLFLIS